MNREATETRRKGLAAVRHGLGVDFDEAAVRSAPAAKVINQEVTLGAGTAEATALGCDLTAVYIDENAAC